MNRRLLALVGTGLLLGAMLPLSVSAKAPDQTFTKGGVFIVQLADAPVVAYKGGKAGLKATAPAKGEKINPNSAKVTKYADFLRSRQDAELAAVGGGKKLASYVYSFNGFAARLSAKKANALAIDKDVVSVSPDEIRFADTSSTPDFLGLTADGGIWDQLGGPAWAGEGVIIGVIDSGIWPESLSFADRIKGGKPSNAPERQARLPADPRLARQVRARGAVHGQPVQPEADRRPVLQRGLGRQQGHQRRPPVGVQLRP